MAIVHSVTIDNRLKSIIYGVTIDYIIWCNGVENCRNIQITVIGAHAQTVCTRPSFFTFPIKRTWELCYASKYYCLLSGV